MDWYVIQAYSGYEQKVKLLLKRDCIKYLSEKLENPILQSNCRIKAAQKNTERSFPWYI